MNAISYRNLDFPPSIIQRAIWLYARFNLSFRDIVTDKWRAYAAAFRDMSLNAWHRQAKWKNNRIEGSHVRIRRRERAMQGFRSPGSAQRFLSIYAAVYNHFTTRRHLISAAEHRHRRDQAFTTWRTAAYAAA